MNPCDNCKKKPNCPERCFPKMDYERGKKKRRRNGKHEKINRQNPRGRGEGAGGDDGGGTMNESTEADTICRTCLRLWQGLCDGEKEQTACKWYKHMTNDWLKQEAEE